jgi:type 1 glutamine amidotransferase
MDKESQIKTAVVTGGHAFDVLHFHQFFRDLSQVDAYIQHLEEWSASSEQIRDSYDAVLFYFMPTEGPAAGGREKAALEHLGESKQGIVVLHHAILAYPDWPLWDQVVGIQDRRFDFYEDQEMRIEVVDPDHPITGGLQGWQMIDETYAMNDAGPDSEVLLTIDHPHSMRTIAWTRHHKRARVFCLELGHDDRAWSDPHLRTIVERGLQWVSGK